MPKKNMHWGELSYQDFRGEDIPLLLLHGTGCDSEDWMETIESLPPNRHIITMDFRSHGKSGLSSKSFSLRDLANDVLALLTCLGIKRVVIMGHSLGGMVAMDIASRSKYIEGLILLEGWTCLNAMKRSFSNAHSYGNLSKDVIKRIKDKSTAVRAKIDGQNWSKFWSTVQGFSALSFLETTQIPIEHVYGNFGILPYTERNLLVPKCSGRGIQWIEGAGHYLPQEQPGSVSAICTSFMKRNHFWL